jgi:predicted short-subunit dehydrogenase-like oxidoreductase (DUF2520 family)
LRKSLSIVGAGKVGKTLGRLFSAKQVYAVWDVLNRSATSGQAAVAFIGAGRAVTGYADLLPADIYLIAAPDDQIGACCEQLVQAGRVAFGSVVFHCSGALPSSALQAATQAGAVVAAIHPIRSFADPEQVAQTFSGTWCGVEGDQRALDILAPAFAEIGAQTVTIDPTLKVLYHAAAVFACNFLPALLDTAQQTYVKSGVPDDIALQLMEPLVRETIDNIFRLGPAAALTGPVARGDMTSVARQQNAVADWNPQYAELYKELTKLTVDLAARRPAKP